MNCIVISGLGYVIGVLLFSAGLFLWLSWRASVDAERRRRLDALRWEREARR